MANTGNRRKKSELRNENHPIKNRHRRRILAYTSKVKGKPFRQEPIRIIYHEKSTNKAQRLHGKVKRKRSGTNSASLEESTAYREDDRRGRSGKKQSDYKKHPGRTICALYLSTDANFERIQKQRTFP